MTRLTVGKHLIVPLAATVIGAGGCSSVQPPTGTISQAQLAIREAEQNKAAQHAPLELRKAREKLNQAEQAMRNEEYLTARRLSEQALVDARLAEVKAESDIARQNAADLQKAIKSLRAEAERGSSN